MGTLFYHSIYIINKLNRATGDLKIVYVYCAANVNVISA
jgi:hypothetical protein